MAHHKIIIVEDDADDVESISAAFEAIGNKEDILFIESGYELIKHLEHIGPAAYPLLIILDYNMPRLNGGKVLRLLKENPFTSRIPVLIYSTSLLPETKKEIEEYGALLYIKKGTNINALMEQATFFLELIEPA